MTETPVKPAGHLARLALPIVLLSLSALGGWIAWSVNQVRQRDRMLTEIELAEGSVVMPNGETQAAAIQGNLPLTWRMCGAKPVRWLLLPEQEFNQAERARIRRLFPEARVGRLSRGGNRTE